MHAFKDGLKLTKSSIGDVASGVGKGLQNISSTVEQGFKSDDEHKQDGTPTQRNQDSPSQSTTITAQSPDALPVPDSSSAPAPASSESHPKSDTPPVPASSSSSFLGSLGSTLTSTSTTLLSTSASAAKSGASLAFTTTRDATTAGLSIGTSIARSGLDAGADVVSLTTGTASLAGTALGGVVAAAAETSGAVFEPIGSGLKTLKALEGLDRLGQDTINGLSLGAVKKVSELTTKALNMSGKTPTFFDPDADGIVRVPDTVRGLVLLGLDEKNASYAAYALHGVFSYSTSDSWIPALDKSLPIRVANMAGTKWGKNWGNFERLEWVDDVEIDKFFVPQKSKKTLSDYWKQGRQGFGILLLIFEWGTTWPFYMPPLTVPLHQIPFANDIGSVVRKAILPTIVSNFEKARALNPQPQGQKPSAKSPEDPINMPGEFTG